MSGKRKRTSYTPAFRREALSIGMLPVLFEKHQLQTAQAA
jgi:hypothetical protein